MFLEMFNQAGMIAWPILLVSVLLITFGLLLLIFHKNLKVIRVFLILSSLPFLMGLYGYIAGNGSFETVKVGIIFSVPVLILGLLSLLIHKLRFKKKS